MEEYKTAIGSAPASAFSNEETAYKISLYSWKKEIQFWDVDRFPFMLEEGEYLKYILSSFSSFSHIYEVKQKYHTIIIGKELILG